ncbi:MAG: pantetheine-phosphate adenylyltransferase [Clostridia bacterium]|nr:pantetheine-phosphate adenylyltransferase [Clostridia bacterium]
MKRLAVLPGSFDPVTLGHVELARRIAALFGSCRVVVMNNRDKEYLLSLEERYELCRSVFEKDENVQVDFSEDMLYSYLNGIGEPCVLVKGVRNEKDYLYEKNMAAFNYAHAGVETLYLDAREEMTSVSSTLARDCFQKNEDLSSILPQEVVKHLQNKL